MYCTSDITLFTPQQQQFVFGNRGVESFISWFFQLGKSIREDHKNFPRSHRFNNLFLVEKVWVTIRKESGVSKVYTF